LGLPVSWFALFHWKDSPDLWMSAAYIGSLWTFLLFLRHGRRRLLAFSFLLWVFALTFKEMAYTLPFALVLLLWHEHRLRTHWRFLIAFWIFAPCAFAYRTWALEGFGFRFGSNGSWKERAFVNLVGGYPGTLLTYGDMLAWAVAFGGWAAVMAWQKRRVPGLLLGGAAIFCWLFTELRFSESFGDALSRLLVWDAHFRTGVAQATLMLLLWGDLARRFKTPGGRIQRFAWGWAVVTYLPLMTAPITRHALYLVSWGWSLWLAIALLSAWDTLRLRWATGPATFPKTSLLRQPN
jgi:hypothetical protein